MSDIDDRSQPSDACTSCSLLARREFLRDAALAAAGALIALGASPAAAAAAPVEFISAIGGAREEKAYPIPAADGAQIDKGNDAIIMRWQGKVYAFGLACPHQNTAVKWYDSDKQFECPKHHSRYTPDGIYVKDSGRATRGLDRLAVRKDGTRIVVNLDKLFQEDEDEEAWKTAFVTV
jgi:nitrite reductase/ring-hydroxylating ferredoxin subunit